MTSTHSVLTRRAMMATAATAAASAAVGAAHAFRASPALATVPGPLIHGRISPPVALPDIALTMQDGTTQGLASLLKGRATAIQAMFTECTTTCPLGAATFMQVQALVPDQLRRGIQLLSIDIGPFGNKPSKLGRWLERFHAEPGWMAAVPTTADVPVLRAMFGLSPDPSDPHSTQIQIADRSSQLIWRTYEMPSADDIAYVLMKI